MLYFLSVCLSAFPAFPMLPIVSEALNQVNVRNDVHWDMMDMYDITYMQSLTKLSGTQMSKNLAIDTHETPATSIADALPVSDQPANRMILIGTPDWIKQKIHSFHVAGIVPVWAWSQPMPTRNQGEMISVLKCPRSQTQDWNWERKALRSRSNPVSFDKQSSMVGRDTARLILFAMPTYFWCRVPTAIYGCRFEMEIGSAYALCPTQTRFLGIAIALSLPLSLVPPRPIYVKIRNRVQPFSRNHLAIYYTKNS